MKDLPEASARNAQLGGGSDGDGEEGSLLFVRLDPAFSSGAAQTVSVAVAAKLTFSVCLLRQR